ncbi:MAG: GNAT family N-acetyltransferase [Anaerolineales bacterium]|nr:GNAT family N-acetyltransferase [Anaerolineales bacterium]
MFDILEVHRNELTISTNPQRLDLNAISDFLSRAYWAQGRTRLKLERALKNSLVFGVYDGEQQIGLARVVSDYAIFAYLCDVFIRENYRAQGIGKWLMATVFAHPELQGLRRWALVTLDAHRLYQSFGFTTLNNPEEWMEKLVSSPS